MKLLLGNGLWHLVSQADVMTKFVLSSLLLASIVCWTLVFYKLVLLNLKRKQLKSVAKKIKKIETIDQLVTLANQELKSFPGHLLVEQLQGSQHFLEHASKETFVYELAAVDEHRLTTIEDMIQVEEMYLPMLAVTSSVAPLVGLFGTVWGLTHSFMSISEKQTADIITIAPGIAEALLTTLAGLMVAIPVAIMYFYLKTQVDQTEFQLHKISEKIHNIIRLTVLEKRDGREISISQKKASKGTIAS